MNRAELAEQTRRCGPYAYLATVGPDATPHVVPIHVDWHEDRLYALVGRDDVKMRNLRANPALCLHWQVGESSGWDSLIAWGHAAVLTQVEDKRRLWEGVLSYDLNYFAPGGPDGSPDSVFLEIDVDRAVLLRRFGLDGRDDYGADADDPAKG